MCAHVKIQFTSNQNECNKSIVRESVSTNPLARQQKPVGGARVCDLCTLHTTVLHTTHISAPYIKRARDSRMRPENCSFAVSRKDRLSRRRHDGDATGRLCDDDGDHRARATPYDIISACNLCPTHTHIHARTHPYVKCMQTFAPHTGHTHTQKKCYNLTIRTQTHTYAPDMNRSAPRCLYAFRYWACVSNQTLTHTHTYTCTHTRLIAYKRLLPLPRQSPALAENGNGGHDKRVEHKTIRTESITLHLITK